MFRESLHRLESNDCCHKLGIQSYLLQPMQRITKLPLLLREILKRFPLDSHRIETAHKCVQRVSVCALWGMV